MTTSMPWSKAEYLLFQQQCRAYIWSRENLLSDMTTPRWQSFAVRGLVVASGHACTLAGFRSTWVAGRVFRTKKFAKLALAS